MMQKTKQSLFPIAGVLALDYAACAIIAGVCRLLFYGTRGTLDQMPFWDILRSYIYPSFIVPIVFGAVLSIGLFYKKRSLIVCALAVNAGLLLIRILFSAAAFLFDTSGSLVLSTYTVSFWIGNAAAAVFYVALLFMVLHLFRPNAGRPAYPGAPAPQTRSANLFPIAGVLMLLYAVLRVVSFTLYVLFEINRLGISGNFHAIFETVLYLMQYDGSCFFALAGVLIAVGLFRKKRKMILIGLAVPAAYYVIVFLIDIIQLFSMPRIWVFLYIDNIFSALSGTVLQTAILLLFIALFRMNGVPPRKRKREAQPAPAQTEYPTFTQSVPAQPESPTFAKPVPAQSKRPTIAQPVPAQTEHPTIAKKVPAQPKHPTFAQPVPAQPKRPTFAQPVPAQPEPDPEPAGDDSDSVIAWIDSILDDIDSGKTQNP